MKLSWIAVAGGLLGVLAVFEAPERTLLWDAVFDFGHFPLFALFSWSLLHAVRSNDSSRREWALLSGIFVLTVGVAAMSEVVQFLQPTRNPSLADFIRDVAGSAAGLIFSTSGTTNTGHDTAIRRAVPGLVALFLSLIAVIPLIVTFDVYRQRARAFPTLARFDGSRWERRLRSLMDASLYPGTTEVVSTSGPLARLTLHPGVYPRLVLREPYPDWSPYQTLVLSIVADQSSPAELKVRVHDCKHDERRFDDRFNADIVLRPGVQRITIPLDQIRNAPRYRQLDLTCVRGLVLYAVRLERESRVWLGPIHLE